MPPRFAPRAIGSIETKEPARIVSNATASGGLASYAFLGRLGRLVLILPTGKADPEPRNLTTGAGTLFLHELIAWVVSARELQRESAGQRVILFVYDEAAPEALAKPVATRLFGLKGYRRMSTQPKPRPPEGPLQLAAET